MLKGKFAKWHFQLKIVFDLMIYSGSNFGTHSIRYKSENVDVIVNIIVLSFFEWHNYVYFQNHTNHHDSDTFN